MKPLVKTLTSITLALSPSLITITPVIQTHVQASEVSSQFVNSNCLLIDVARRHMTYDQIRSIINTIDPNQFPYLQLHLSDNQGFAIKTSILNGQGWITKRQITSLCNLAQQRGITVIPDIDVPSHAGGIIQDLKNMNSHLVNEITMDNETLDYTKQSTLDFVEDLYSEVLPCFTQKDLVVIGSDEVPGNISCANNLANFINQLNAKIRSLGWQQSAVWNDSINPQVQKNLSKKILILNWNNDHQDSLKNSFTVKDAYSDDPSNMNIEDIKNRQYTRSFINQWNNYHNRQPGYLSLWSNGNGDNNTKNNDILNFVQKIQR